MRYFIVITSLSFCWCLILLGAGVAFNWITISPEYNVFYDIGSFFFRHLRSSIIPFSILFILYLVFILKMRLNLISPGVAISEVTFLDRLLNVIISAFFGVGIIWTAIGMETALMHALAGMTNPEGLSSDMSALGLLDKLVNGGLLLALSTTVFGGACGYLLRIFKIIYIGKKWDQMLLEEVNQNETA